MKILTEIWRLVPTPFQAKNSFCAFEIMRRPHRFSDSLRRSRKGTQVFNLFHAERDQQHVGSASSCVLLLCNVFSLQVCGLSSVIGQAHGRTSTKSLSRNYHLNSHNVKLHKASLRAEYFYSLFSIFVLNIEIGQCQSFVKFEWFRAGGNQSNFRKQNCI